ncbi:MAG: oligosaccharide flippase family protein [Phoenicibacter congonensis]|uniref:Oligosaccharide flippase family protein n=1 Tax=Phoenicibacter congonensis TaxID=1944646 RepID=A0AA43RIG9_9ACTN|nr:oligosaccharide flippase family protein [Phoenicibacter congonensis]
MSKAIEKYHAMPVQAKAAIWFAICSVITKCISMITVPIFTRLMTTEQYGVYSVYNSWLQMVTVVATLRLDYAVFNKGMSKFPEERDTYTVSMQTFTSIIVVFLALVYIPFADIINSYTGLSTFITLMMFLEIVFTAGVSYWMTRRRYEYKYRSIILTTLLISVGNALLGVAGVLIFEQKDVARIASCVLVYCIVGTVIYIVNISRGGVLIKWRFIKFALAFNLPLLPHYAAMYVIDSFDLIMIQAMVGFSAAAIYSVACSLGNVLKIVTNSINNAIVPWMYEMLGACEYKKLGKATSLVILVPVVPVLLLILVAPEVIWLFGGDTYAEA